MQLGTSRSPGGAIPPATSSIAELAQHRQLADQAAQSRCLVDESEEGSVPGTVIARCPLSLAGESDVIEGERDPGCEGGRRMNDELQELLHIVRKDLLLDNNIKGADAVIDLLTVAAAADELRAAMRRNDEQALIFHAELLNEVLARFCPLDLRIVDH